MDLIPANVTARILPKTLFGEKYVELEIPAEPSSSHIAAGDVITETVVPIEVETVFADAYPLLTAVQPAQLAYTLNALATALEGRGDDAGRQPGAAERLSEEVQPVVPIA